MAAAAVVENNNNRFERLKSEGWHLCPVKVLAEIEEFDKLSSKAALEELKNTDIKNVGIASFPEDASKAGKLDRLEGPLVTQVQKVRNVAAPKANEGSQAAPRMLKLTLTDGVSSVNAIELETINHVGFHSLNE